MDYLCEGSEGPGPHRIRISPYDSERRIWLVNETSHQIYVLANDGSKVLATYGEKLVPGNDKTHYSRPQDVAFMPDGRILVADGLDNNRVVVYDNNMNYITEFGSSFGTTQVYFCLPSKSKLMKRSGEWAVIQKSFSLTTTSRAIPDISIRCSNLKSVLSLPARHIFTP